MQPLSPITKRQSAVERELVLRLASLLWRLRWATTMETGPFETQADHFGGFLVRNSKFVLSKRRDLFPTHRDHRFPIDRDHCEC
jgi:hypothetical protein